MFFRGFLTTHMVMAGSLKTIFIVDYRGNGEVVGYYWVWKCTEGHELQVMFRERAAGRFAVDLSTYTLSSPPAPPDQS